MLTQHFETCIYIYNTSSSSRIRIANVSPFINVETSNQACSSPFLSWKKKKLALALCLDGKIFPCTWNLREALSFIILFKLLLQTSFTEWNCCIRERKVNRLAWLLRYRVIIAVRQILTSSRRISFNVSYEF